MAFKKFTPDSSLVTSVVPAYFGYQSRTATPDLVVIHSTEGSESFQSAENGASYAAKGNPDKNGKLRPASVHYFVDPNSIVQCVPEIATAFGAKGANSRGIHVELCGLSTQTAAQWADIGSAAEIELAAKLFADICKRRRIPRRLLTARDLLGGKTGGITTHNEVNKAWPSTGHTDPGKNFPLATFIMKAKLL